MLSGAFMTKLCLTAKCAGAFEWGGLEPAPEGTNQRTRPEEPFSGTASTRKLAVRMHGRATPSETSCQASRDSIACRLWPHHGLITAG